MGRINGCLTKLLLWAVVGDVLVWALIVVLNPWALHIGGRSTPLLYWHGAGTVLAKGGKALPLYVSFWPGRPQGFAAGGRREGKIVSARLQGTGWFTGGCTDTNELNYLVVKTMRSLGFCYLENQARV